MVDAYLKSVCGFAVPLSLGRQVTLRVTAEGKEQGCGEDPLLNSLAKQGTALGPALDSLPDPKEITAWAHLPCQ